MLYPNNEEGKKLVPRVIKFILKECQESGVTVSVNDYNQIYQYLLLTNESNEESDLMGKLRTIWNESNKMSIVTKLEQDVLD